MRIVVLILGVAALALAALLGRYEIVSVSDRDEAAVVRFDRWTGRGVLCAARGCLSLKLGSTRYTITKPDGSTGVVDFDHDPVRAEIDAAAARLPVASPTP